MSNLQSHYRFKLDFQKADQHTEGKWLHVIHGTKHHKDNQLQSLEIPRKILNREAKHEIKESEGNMFNPIFKDDLQGQKHPGRCVIAKPKLSRYTKPKFAVQNE